MRRGAHQGLLALLVLLLVPAALAGDEPLTPERVERLLHRSEEHGEAWAELERRGWERVAPFLDLRSYATSQARRAAIEFAHVFGSGPRLYDLALQAMRSGDEETARRGIELLEGALLGTPASGAEEDEPRLRFDPRWWPDLLRELHATEVVILDSFFSGPSFPSWSLRDLLTEFVHGHEEELVQAARHDDWRIRMMALPILGATRTGRTPRVEGALRRALTDPHPKVRQMAVRTAAHGRWHALVDAVGARLLDPDEALEVRAEAAERMGEFEDAARAEAFLLPALGDESPRIRAAAGWGACGLPRTPRLVEALLDRLVDAEDAVRRGAAAGLRPDYPEPTVPHDVDVDEEALVRLLDDPLPEVRAKACGILVERHAVPAARVADLAARLTDDDPRSAEGAALALASLRGAARQVLPAMKTARGRTPRADDGAEPERALRDAIEAVEMAGLDGAALDALLHSESAVDRRRAVRELARRDDTPRLVRALAHADAEVAIRAAFHLVDDPAHTEAVVDAVLRAFPDLEHELPHEVFQRLGSRLEPYAVRVVARWRRTPDGKWLGLLRAVRVLRTHVCEAVWSAFRLGPDWRQVERVAALGDALMPRVLQALVSDDVWLRRGAAQAVASMARRTVVDHAEALYRVLAQMDAEDEARSVLETALEKHDAGRAPDPRTPWIDLR